jgi:hypothetical protein
LREKIVAVAKLGRIMQNSPEPIKHNRCPWGSWHYSFSQSMGVAGKLAPIIAATASSVLPSLNKIFP